MEIFNKFYKFVSLIDYKRLIFYILYKVIAFIMQLGAFMIFYYKGHNNSLFILFVDNFLAMNWEESLQYLKKTIYDWLKELQKKYYLLLLAKLNKAEFYFYKYCRWFNKNILSEKKKKNI